MVNLSVDATLYPISETGGQQVALVMSAEDFQKLLCYLQLDPNARINVERADEVSAEVGEQ